MAREFEAIFEQAVFRMHELQEQLESMGFSSNYAASVLHAAAVDPMAHDGTLSRSNDGG